MTAVPQLLDISGRPFSLERQLASGGEGAVYTIPNDSNRVVKVYHNPPSSQTVEKLKAMVGLLNPKLLEVAAWPSGLLLTGRSRQVAGFVMPRLLQYQPIQHLYNPIMRLKYFPRAGWTFQIRAALNAAAAFDEVHKAGCVIGDVNQSNVQVSSHALVKLIDCDSFQVQSYGKQFLCEVGVPHYTPPELQGKSFRGFIRTENHDRFGLAVIIYQLLFVGKHPYMGIYQGKGDPSFEDLISQFRFAQGPSAHNWGMSPPPRTPTFTDIPHDLATLFRRAFERGSENGSRPRSIEWMPVLQQLERDAVECVADPGHKYWKGQSKCVWCRLAENQGPDFYFGVAPGTADFVVDEKKVQELLRRLESIEVLDFTLDPDQYAPKNPPKANPLPESLDEHGSTERIVRGIFLACLLLMPLGFIRAFLCAGAFLAATFFGIWLFILIWHSPWRLEFHRRKRAKMKATFVLNEIEEDWEEIARQYRRDHSRRSNLVRNLVAECRSLALQYQKDLQRLSESAEALARERHMRLHLIDDASIANVGARRKQTLASHGISTAADVDMMLKQYIPGFGDVLVSNIVAWRNTVLQQFRFDPKMDVSPTDQKAIAIRYRNEQSQLLDEIERRLTQLVALAPDCHAKLQKLEPDLRNARLDWEQADADFQLLIRHR